MHTAVMIAMLYLCGYAIGTIGGKLGWSWGMTLVVACLFALVVSKTIPIF
jgi:hypothetical protein